MAESVIGFRLDINSPTCSAYAGAAAFRQLASVNPDA